MERIGVYDKDSTGIGRIVGKKTGNSDFLCVWIVGHAVSVFIVGLGDTEGITVLFYRVAISVCVIAVEGDQGIRFGCLFRSIYQAYDILIGGTHGLEPAFFIDNGRFCHHIPGYSF